MRFGVENKKILFAALIIFSAFFGDACGQTQEQKMKQIKEHEEKAKQFRYQKKFDEAIKEQQKAVDIDRNYVGSWVLLGTIYSEATQWQKAVDALNKAVELEPKDAVIYALLGNAWEHLNNLQKSIEYRKKAVSLEPDNIDYLVNLGATQNLLEDNKSARVSYEKAFEIDPNYTGAIYNLAILEEEEGNIEKAT